MPRGRTLLLTVLAIIALIIFAKSSSSSDQRFYDSTLERLQSKQRDAQQQKMGTAAVMEAKLKEAAVKVKAEVEEAAEKRRKKQDNNEEGTDERYPGPHGAKPKQKVMGGVEKDGAVREGRPHDVGTARGKWTNDDGTEDATEEKPEQTKEQKAVDAELTSILKRSPIIIFSKTYCPYSKKAKAVFSKYDITPAPFIFEVNEYEYMEELQNKLSEMTGRRTVPNVMISGKSIGGGDDVAALHEKGDLLGMIKDMGGKRIIKAKQLD